MRWLAAVGKGLAAGALLSVLPSDFGCILTVPFTLAVLAFVGTSERRREMGVVTAIAASIGVLAIAAPLKFVDRTHVSQLSSRCVRIEEVLHALKTRSTVSAELMTQETCFDSKEPTIREVERTLAPFGVTIHYGYCGNGATLLWGAAPMGGPRLSVGP